MAWQDIYMDEVTWLRVKEEAQQRGWVYPKARRVAQQDLFQPFTYLFMSGVPQAILLEILKDVGN